MHGCSMSEYAFDRALSAACREERADLFCFIALLLLGFATTLLLGGGAMRAIAAEGVPGWPAGNTAVS